MHGNAQQVESLLRQLESAAVESEPAATISLSISVSLLCPILMADTKGLSKARSKVVRSIIRPEKAACCEDGTLRTRSAYVQCTCKLCSLFLCSSSKGCSSFTMHRARDLCCCTCCVAQQTCYALPLFPARGAPIARCRKEKRKELANKRKTERANYRKRANCWPFTFAFTFTSTANRQSPLTILCVCICLCMAQQAGASRSECAKIVH